jgi:hypothetical protein
MTEPITAEQADYQRMMGMVTGYWVTQIVRAAAQCRLAEHLAAGTRTPEAVAEVEGTDPDSTRRLMRTCASLGLMTSADGHGYRGTPLLNTLHPDAPNSLHGFTLSTAGPGFWLSWGRFPDAVRTGEQQFPAAHGHPTLFDYFAAHPDEASLFTQSMANMSQRDALKLAAVLDTRQTRHALDVGGANGVLIRTLMRANPELTGGVLDLPHIVPDATAAAKQDGLSERFTAVGGDFFVEVPPSDLYLVKYILHDWDDQQCVRILSNCRAALEPGGRVAVIETLIEPGGTPSSTPLMDMNMLTMTGGREREIAEVDALFAAAGLRRTAVTPAGQFTVIESVPAQN